MRNGRLRGWMLPVVLLLGSGVLGAVRDARAGGDITWARDYASGLKQARQTRRPLLLSFHTPGCGWCAKLDEETFTDPQVVDLSHRYVCVRIDSDIDADACTHYQVLEYPLTILADPQGSPLLRLPGYIPPDRFAPLLRAALKSRD